MANLFGTGINQVPTNGMLGNLAFQDKAYVSVDKIGIGTTAVDTGTANQTLQNYGGAYITGNVGLGTTTPSSVLSVIGDTLITGVSTSARITLNGANSTTTGGGQIYLNGASGNRIDFNINGVAAPTFTTRSAGTKLALYPLISASQVDYGFGIEANTLWSSVEQATSVYAHRWYGGTTQLADLKGSGELVIGSTSLTGTSSQRLQVTGGGYFSSNLGIGRTNPSVSLHITGGSAIGAILERNTTGESYIRYQNSSGTIHAGISTNATFWGIGDSTNFTTAPYFVVTNTTGNVGIGTTNPVGQLQVASGPVIIGAATSTGTANQKLQVTGGAYISSNVGVGTTVPAYIFTVTDTGTPATTGLTNCLADFTTTANSYGQINLRNTSTGTNASSDIVITADNGSDTTNFIDLGINNSNYSVGSWTINGVNDGYLYTSDGNLSIGAINASVPKYISFFTGGTLLSNERMRINAIGVGIGSTNPTSRLDVVGDGKFTGIVTATQFTTGSGNLGFTTNTINGPSEIIIDPLPVGVGTTSGIVRIRGDLYVDGTQFIVNSTTIELADFNVGIASTVGTLALLDGAGIGIGSANIRKTITWNNTAGALTSSDDWNLASGKQYEINGTSVLTSTTLGSGVVNSSLTSVGTLGQLNVSGVSTFANNINLNAALSLPQNPNGVGFGTTTANPQYAIRQTMGDNDGWQIFGESPSGTNTGSLVLEVNDDNADEKIVFRNRRNYSGAVIGVTTFLEMTTSANIMRQVPLLINSSTLTGTSSQNLQVSGGAYVSGDLGIGITNPQRKLHLRATGADGVFLDNSDQTGNSGGPLLRVRGQRVDGNGSQAFSGQLVLEKWNMNAAVATNTQLGAIVFGGNFDTLPGITTGMTYGASIGAMAEGTFSGIATAPTAIVFNTGTVGLGTLALANVTYGTEAARITSNRNLLIGTTSETGTASQRLQVSGGAYVSGSVGVGITNPGTNLEVYGTSRFGGTVAAGRRADIDTNGQLTLAFGNNTNQSNLILQNVSDTGSTTNHGNSILWQFGTSTTTTAISAGRINILKEQQWTTTASTQDAYFAIDLALDGALGEKLRVTSAGNVGVGITNPSTKLDVIGNSRIGGAATRSTSGLTVGFSNANTYVPNADVGDGYRMLSLVNESSTTNAMSVLGFRVNPDGGTLNAMLDMRYVNTGATNASALHYTFNHGGSFVDRFSILSSGNIGIGSTAPTSKLDVVGDAKFSGIVTATDFNTTSDENLKTNIVMIEDPLDKIVQIRGVNFEWKENGRRSAGVIAQEIEKVLPELVNGGEIKTVNYNGLIGLLIEVVKEQQSKIESLESRLSKLE